MSRDKDEYQNAARTAGVVHLKKNALSVVSMKMLKTQLTWRTLR